MRKINADKKADGDTKVTLMCHALIQQTSFLCGFEKSQFLISFFSSLFALSKIIKLKTKFYAIFLFN